jgi:hypothetical protein
MYNSIKLLSKRVIDIFYFLVFFPTTGLRQSFAKNEFKNLSMQCIPFGVFKSLNAYRIMGTNRYTRSGLKDGYNISHYSPVKELLTVQGSAL